MQSIKQLEKQFSDQGYSNPLIHAKAKHMADQHFAKMQSNSPQEELKPVKITEFRKSIQNSIRSYIKKGGFISQLAEKIQRKSSVKVAIQQQPVVRYRSQHKLSPQEAIELALAKGVA